MPIYLNYYSTPLWFAFIQAWIYAILLIIRSRESGRLSDVLLALVLIGMSFNIWEYMLGFSGIEFLWKELNFFPRSFGYSFAPLCYYYFKSQINHQFRFEKKHIWSFAPFIIQTFYHITVFALGQNVVDSVESNFHQPYHIPELEFIIGVMVNSYFFIRSLRLYQEYRVWIRTQFSELEAISFKWFRNLLILLLVTFLSSLLMTIIDSVYNLDFEHDWWDKLIHAALIYYVSITGYSQSQPTRFLTFAEPETSKINSSKEKLKTSEIADWKEKLNYVMQEEKLFLQPELSLADTARLLKTNVSTLSGIINAAFDKNFNDFVNEYRVNEFKERCQLPENQNITLLGIAFDCGFNSKATFNRAFKKYEGIAPSEFVKGI